MLVNVACLAACEGQVGQEALVSAIGHECKSGDLIIEIGLTKWNDLQTSRKSLLIEQLEVYSGGGLKRHDILGFSVPEPKSIWAINSKISNCVGDLCDLITRS